MTVREAALECACGCGEKLTPDKRGRFARYRRNHDKRLQGPHYLEEDCGYATRCWLWQGHIGTHGYGIARRSEGGQTTAPRVIYEQLRGPIPDGLEPDHLCCVKACVNPDHLELVTRAENTRRGMVGKLTSQQIQEIRELRGFEHHEDVAQTYAVHPAYVRDIWRGRY